MEANIKEQIVKNSFWGFVSSILNRVGGFVLAIFLSRLLMPEGFGKYSLAMTIALFFITLSDLGINQTLIRYVALGVDKTGNESALYLKYLFKIRLFITAILFLVLLLISYPLSVYVFKDPSLFLLFIILSFYIFFISLSSFFESLFFIKEHVRYISAKELISFLFKIISICLIGYFIISEFKLAGIFLSFVVISIFSFLFVFYFSKRLYPSLFRRAFGKLDKKKIYRFILFLNIQNISYMVLAQISIIFLGIYLAKQYVGYYSAPWILVAGISSLIFCFSYTLLPILTTAEEEKFQNLLERTFRLLFTISLPVSFGLSLLSRFFITAFYGYDYLPAAVPLSILAFLIPCVIGIDLSLSSFSARGKQKNFSILMVISTIILLFTNYIFIKIFLANPGRVIIGVSIATLTSWFFCLVFSIFLLKKELNVNVISFWLIKILFSCLIMSAFIIFTTNQSGDMNLFKGIIIIFSSALIYFISLFLMKGLEVNEFKEIFKIFLNLKRK